MNFEQAWEIVRCIRGWLSNKEQGKLIWQQARLGHVIEIGTFCGKSAILTALSMRDAGSTDRVYCIDTFEATNEELKSEDTYDEFLRNVAKYEVEDWIEPIRGNSRDKELAAKVPKNASLVYLDGDHSYTGLLSDIETWRLHVAKGQVLLFHDYYPPGSPYGGQFPDVMKAIKTARHARLLNTPRVIPPDSVYFRRSTCGCGGW